MVPHRPVPACGGSAVVAGQPGHGRLRCACAAGGTAGAGRPVRVEPLILVAAAGGGIRAAWWAEHALADLAAMRCGPHDVFAVSSVSGGSLGMAVLDSAPAGQAEADIARIAGPDALAAGIDGLLLHDLIAGFTGLDLPAAQMPPGRALQRPRRPDRECLAERGQQPAAAVPAPPAGPAVAAAVQLHRRQLGLPGHHR